MALFTFVKNCHIKKEEQLENCLKLYFGAQALNTERHCPPGEAGYPASGTDGKERPAGASDR
jgi:hypothetical protein